VDAEVSELAAFVAVARQVASTLAISTPRSPWLPPLPEWVGVDDLADSRSSSAGAGHPQPPDGVPFGLVDRPHDQQQLVARWDPEVDGHLGVIGGARSGRTTLVRTLVSALAQRHPASALHVHVLEGAAGPLRSLTELPHVGSVVGATDVTLVRRLVERLGEELFGSPSTRPELFVLVVDGWEAIEDALATSAGGIAPDALLRLIRDGAPLGLRVIVTGGRAIGSGRLSSLLDRRLVLPMPDPLDRTLVGLEPAAARHPRTPGRAIDLADGSDLQVATMGSGPSHDEQAAALHRIAASLRATADCPPAQRAWRILPLPRLVTTEELVDRVPPPRPPARAARESPPWVWLGMAGDGAEPTAVDVAGAARRFLVVGPSRSGRSNVLELAARQLAARGRAVAVVAARRSPLQALAGERNVHVISPGDGRSFVDLRRVHPDLAVLVDDAESLDRSDLEGALIDWAGLLDESGGLIWASADMARANAAFRGLIPAIARDGSGIILGACASADGDCLQARPDPVGRSVPGRGDLVLDSRCLPIQIAQVAPLEAPKGWVPDERHTGGGAAPPRGAVSAV
jgi:S-DNA-T family DNA segregation ATPase FtsK/SpoIIIE